MESAVAHRNGAEDMLCPCRDCGNGVRHPIKDVKFHVIVPSMSKTYTWWIYPGESLDNSEISDTTTGCGN